MSFWHYSTHSARSAQMNLLWACSLPLPTESLSLAFGLSAHFTDSSKTSSILLFHALVCLPKQNVCFSPVCTYLSASLPWGFDNGCGRSSTSTGLGVRRLSVVLPFHIAMTLGNSLPLCEAQFPIYEMRGWIGFNNCYECYETIIQNAHYSYLGQKLLGF